MNSKATDQRHQRILLDLVKQPGNDVCADCKGRTPRWASWNLGVFVCVQCAGVHRKMGTHISKIKSLNLDSWTREQVERMREVGNVKSNALYNPDEVRNRPPMNMEESERDSELEKYIRRKYEFRSFVEKAPPPVPVKDASARRHLTPRSSSSSTATLSTTTTQQAPRSPQRSGQASLAPPRDIARSNTAPIPASWGEAVKSASPAPVTATATAPAPPPPTLPTRASSRVENTNGQQHQQQQQQQQRLRASSAANPQTTSSTSHSSVFDDLISLQTPAQSTPQPPIQMTPWATLQQQQQHHVQQQHTGVYHQQQQYPMASPTASLSPMSAYAPAQSPTSLGSVAFSQSPSPSNGLNSNPFLAVGGAGYGMGVGPIGGMPMSAPGAYAGGFAGHASPYGGSPSPGLAYGNNPYAQAAQQQQQQQQSPTGFQQSPNGFNSFASGMMPGQQQPMQQTMLQPTNPYAQYAQAQPQSPWGQPQQNMWG